MAEQCKYSRDRIKLFVQEHGLYTAVEEIDSSAVQDADLRKVWKKIEDGWDQLAQLLNDD